MFETKSIYILYITRKNYNKSYDHTNTPGYKNMKDLKAAIKMSWMEKKYELSVHKIL